MFAAVTCQRRVEVEATLQTFQIERQILDVLIPLPSVLLERFCHDAPELGRRIPHVCSHWRRVGLENRGNHVAAGSTFESRTAGKHFVQDHAETPDIRSRVGLQPARLLGRHVMDGAEDLPGLRICRGGGFCVLSAPTADKLCEPEIEDLHDPVFPDHDVFGLDIAMHDARGMSGPERRCDLDADVDDFSQLQLFPVHPLAQTLTLDELRGHKRRAVVYTDLIDRQDVRVIQARGGVRLELEAPEPLTIASGVTRQHLDGDLATQ